LCCFPWRRLRPPRQLRSRKQYWRRIPSPRRVRRTLPHRRAMPNGDLNPDVTAEAPPALLRTARFIGASRRRVRTPGREPRPPPPAARRRLIYRPAAVLVIRGRRRPHPRADNVGEYVDLTSTCSDLPRSSVTPAGGPSTSSSARPVSKTFLFETI
jgi:hypothetical protein